MRGSEKASLQMVRKQRLEEIRERVSISIRGNSTAKAPR